MTHQLRLVVRHRHKFAWLLGNTVFEHASTWLESNRIKFIEPKSTSIIGLCGRILQSIIFINYRRLFKNHYFCVISNFFRWLIAAQPLLNSPSSLKFFEMYISIVQVNMGTDHLWLTTWSSVVTGIMISPLPAPPSICYPWKITPFDTHMYEPNLGTPTDHLWSTTWSGVVTSTTFITSITINVFFLKNDDL